MSGYALLLLLFTLPSSPGPPHPATQVLRIHVEYAPAAKTHYIRLSNYGLRAMCLSSYALDAGRTYISLADANGRLVRGPYVEEMPTVLRGVDLQSGYYVLLPGVSRDFYIDDRKFIAKAGAYTYHVEVPYFYCGDLRKFDDVHDKSDIRMFRAISDGPFQLKN